MTEKPLGITKPKLKTGRIQLPVSVAEGNTKLSAEASVGAVDYAYRHTSSTTLNSARQK